MDTCLPAGREHQPTELVVVGSIPTGRILIFSSNPMDHNELYMREALKEAQKAFVKDEVPVGCVVVHKGKIIGRGHNQVEMLKDPTAHAEMLALTSATGSLASKWLNEADVYVTIEPCSMCAGAMVLARVKNLYYGCDDPKTGACGSVFDIARNKKLNHRIKVTKGLLKDECVFLLKGFFRSKRSK